MELMTPVAIDLVSAVVRMGKDSRVSRWRIVQALDPNLALDWVLKRTKEGSPHWDRDDAVIPIKFGEGRAPQIIHYDQGALYTGTCKSTD